MYHAPVRSTLPAPIRRMMPPGFSYLGEDANNYYFVAPEGPLEMGGIGDMFKRMTKFTSKSFTFGNIYKGFVNTALGVGSAGLIYALPKNVRKTIYNVSKVAIPVVAAGIGAYYAGPAVMSMLGPKLSAAGSLLGKTASTIGGKLFDFLGKLAPNKQAEVAQQITPQQIAKLEQSPGIPPELAPLFQNAMSGSLPYAMQPGSGVMRPPAEFPPYAPEEPEDGLPTAHAGVAGGPGGSPLSTALLFGVPLAFFLLQPKGSR